MSEYIGPGSHILGRGTEKHAIIGNSMMNAAIRMDGNLHRLFWPTVGYPQHVKDSYAGISCEDQGKKRFSWLTETAWKKDMKYLGDTNVLTITYVNDELGVVVRETAFVDYMVSLLVRRFEITSVEKDKNVIFYYYQAPSLGENLYGDAATVDESTNVVIQYYRSYYIGVGFMDLNYSCVCGVCEEENECAAKIEDDMFSGPKVAISIGRRGVYSLLGQNLGLVKKNTTKPTTILVSASKSDYHSISLIAWARSMGYEHLLNRTLRYWDRFLKSTENKISTYEEKILRLFNRSVLVLKLLADRRYGGIIAAPTLDPDYRYVWIRDATYMASALDMSGRHLEAEKFYMWCSAAQTPEGGFKQRYFPNPRYPGPYWSDQLDQLSIIIWGCRLHYDITGDKGFLFRVWPMINRIADYLEHAIDDEGRVVKSGDIWEEGNVRHIYTAASVCAAMRDAAKIANILKKNEKQPIWLDKHKRVYRNILDEFWNEELGCFVKRVEPYSDVLDISTLSLSIPFDILPADDERMVQTARMILDRLSFPNGGIGRFENDPNYGGNPWPISTLWMSMYLAKLGDVTEAKKLHAWVTEQCNTLYLLPEQVDKNTGEPLSALPLGWSHAMYILATSMLYGRGGAFL